MDDREFVCESDLNRTEIHANTATGALVFWRIDAAGRRWFRRVSGVPAACQVEMVDAEGNILAEDDIENIEADDVETAELLAFLDERGVGFDDVPFAEDFDDDLGSEE